MKPHDNAEVLKLASKLRLYAILFRDGADCLQQYDQAVAMATQQQPTQNFFSVSLSGYVLRFFSLELAMKAVLAYVSPKKPKHIHNLSELFNTLQAETSGNLASAVSAQTNLTNEQIAEFVDRQANAFPTIRYPDTGNWTISIPDTAILEQLGAVMVNIAQNLDEQSGAAEMLKAEQEKVTPDELQKIVEQMLNQ